MTRVHNLGLLVWGCLLAVGCGSASGDICDRADDCGFIGDISISECVERVEDGVDDGRVSPRNLEDCAHCLNDPENACTEILAECVSDCGEVYAEVILGR